MVNQQSSMIFHPFGVQHLIVLVAIAVACALVFRLAGTGSSRMRRWLGRILGLALLGYIACIYLQQGLSHSLRWEYSLPLELVAFLMFLAFGRLWLLLAWFQRASGQTDSTS
jgi:hypothetical protein